jgi:hypothetical protein
MTSYSDRLTPRTACAIGIVVLTGNLSGDFPDAGRSQLCVAHQELYEQQFISPTGNSGRLVSDSSPMDVDQQLISVVTGLYAQLVRDEEPLGREFAKILYDNLWELYEG